MGSATVIEHLDAGLYRIEVREAGPAQILAMMRELSAAGEELGGLDQELAALAAEYLHRQGDEESANKWLDSEIEDWVKAIQSGEDPDPPIDPTDESQDGAVLSWQSDLLSAHNAIRSAHGLSSLSAESRLAAAAQRHAQDLSRTGQWGHQGSDGTWPEKRAADAGYPFGVPGSSVGENQASGQKSVDQVMDGWMNSPVHRANILKAKWVHVGFGYAYRAAGKIPHQWVAVFGVPGD